MNILHIGITAHFTEKMTYQDNMITNYNCSDGNNVTYVSDCYIYSNGIISETEEEDKYLPNGLHLIRCKYDRVFNKYITKKVAKIKKLRKIINEIRPDVILYHGIGNASLKYVIEYKKKHPEVILYADCHASFYNSSQNILSKMFNKYFHGYYIKKSVPYFSKIFYVGVDAKDYLQKMYNINDELLEWLPLGGIVSDSEQKKNAKKQIIDELKLPRDCIIFSHSGKLVKEKKTYELIEAFKRVNDKRFVLLIFGSIPEEIKSIILSAIKEDDRIYFLGWKIDTEIQKLLLATDVYCQPGTVSATFQNSICAGCVALSYPWKTYSNFDSEFIYWIKNKNDIVRTLTRISNNSDEIECKKSKALCFANKYLDYSKISKRIYS